MKTTSTKTAAEHAGTTTKKKSEVQGRPIDWNRICKSLVYAKERLAEMYVEVYAKDLGEWPGEVDADLVGELDRRGRGRARKGKFGEQALWWGLYQIYGSANFAWKVCDAGLHGRKRIGICSFHEFPVVGEFAKLLPDGDCDDAGQVRLDDRHRNGSRDRPVSLLTVRIALQMALRKLTALCYRISLLPGVETPEGKIKRPKGLPDGFEETPFGAAELETRLVRVYSRLDEAWNGRFDKTFATDPDEVGKRTLFPREFLRLGGDAEERGFIKEHGVNLRLLRFHINEARGELESMLNEIRYALGEKLEDGEKEFILRDGCDEGRLCAGLAHAYHHLNFAWNGRKKTMAEADSQFSLNENFPHPSESGFCFDRYWSKRCLKCLARKQRRMTGRRDDRTTG